MERSIWTELALIFVVIAMLPFLILLGIFAAMWIFYLIPYLLVGALVFWFMKHKGWLAADGAIPEAAVPVIKKPKKEPAMVEFNGRLVPLGVFVGSTIFSVLALPLFIIALFLWIPWYYSQMIILICIGMLIAKR